MSNLEKILQEKFSLESFREGQKEIIESVIWNNDTLVFMPTGGGKSLTYQLPGVVLEGLTIIISPLISLMKDQVDKLNELGLRAELINSTISFGEQQNILNELSATDYTEDNPIKFLYIAPERLNSSGFLRVISRLKIALIAIDEAHCISQWGHDFRPSYMKIKSFLENLKKDKNFPIIALTATATHKVREDIVDRLGLDKYNSFVKGFDRKNIIIIVREISKKEEKLDKVMEVLNTTPGSGIIYCSSRKMTKEVYDFLSQNGISAGMYTGAMTAESRDDMQNKFMSSEYKVIVATNAFGMGIDKKDIRFVIHYNLPGSIENYYQEVGRAGRDGKKSFGVVLASYGDTKIQEFFIENTYPTKEEVLKFYDYLFAPFKFGEGKDHQILKTYYSMASESGIENDMKAGSIIKILEKYGILKRGADTENDEEFRGRGITLIQEKRKHSEVLIDWSRQDLLKQEAYFKLEQIKRLLFYPTCRKRFILEYFGDEEDLKDLPDNCGACDYCIEKSQFGSGKLEKLVPLSVFEIVIDVVSKFDKRFGTKVIANFLWGSKDKKLLEWRMDKNKDYGILSEYNSELILGVIEALIKYEFLEKTSGQYPLIGLTELGRVSLKREYLLKDEEDNLQSFLSIKCKGAKYKKANPKGETKSKGGKGSKETFNETLKLFNSGDDIKTISEKREMGVQTIESHIIRLYEDGKLGLMDLLKLVNFDNLKKVKDVLNNNFGGSSEILKPIKDKLEELGEKEITYFEIKSCISMIEKGDL